MQRDSQLRARRGLEWQTAQRAEEEAQQPPWPAMEMEKEFEQIDKAGSWAAIYQVREHPGVRKALSLGRVNPSLGRPQVPFSPWVPLSSSLLLLEGSLLLRRRPAPSLSHGWAFVFPGPRSPL